MRDRSQAAIPGAANDTGPHGSGLPPAGVAPGGGNDMASALAAALSARNKKVSHSGKSCRRTFASYWKFVVLICAQMTRTMMMSGTKMFALSAAKEECRLAGLRRRSNTYTSYFYTFGAAARHACLVGLRLEWAGLGVGNTQQLRVY